MKTVSAICPECGQEIQVNPSESVDFCKLCGEPIDVKGAIEFYEETVAERAQEEENARKPSEQTVKKFNAILARDYKLARQYLDNLVKNEYPNLRVPVSYISKLTSELSGRDSLFKCTIYLPDAEKDINNLYSVNPYLAEMYYNVISVQVNTILGRYNYCATKGLGLVKLRLVTIEQTLKYIDEEITKVYRNEEEEERRNPVYISRYDEIQSSKSHIDSFWKSLDTYSKNWLFPLGPEYDDAFVISIIKSVERYASGGRIDIYNESKYVSRGELENLEALIIRLEGLLSQPELQVRKELRAKREAEYKKAYQEEVAFWQEYIRLLNAHKAKKAQAFLETAKRRADVYQSEISKFRKELLGVKYIGNPNLLSANLMAKRTLQQTPFV